MFVFIDYKNKICYIASCKCGNTTIAKHLGVSTSDESSPEERLKILRDNTFKKIIVTRNILDRFYSGFCEDLATNSCYENINISFYEYCLLLKYCYDNKLKNVNNLDCYYKKSHVPIWWGNDRLKKPITNSDGIIDGHIISQFDNINSLVNYVISNSNLKEKLNVLVIDVNNLFLGVQIQNKKTYDNTLNFDYDSKINDIKKNHNVYRSFPEKNKMYNDKIVSIINDIYKKDYEFLERLQNL